MHVQRLDSFSGERRYGSTSQHWVALKKLIVEGEGWRGFRLGTKRGDLIKELGKPDTDPNGQWLFANGISEPSRSRTVYSNEVRHLTYILNSLYFCLMKTAKLFMNGQSQAVRLPKEFRFGGDSVFIQHLGSCVVLVPKNNPWRSMFDATKRFSPDFMAGRDQGEQQERESLD